MALGLIFEAFENSGKIIVGKTAVRGIRKKNAYVVGTVCLERPCGDIGIIAHLGGNLRNALFCGCAYVVVIV